MSSLTHFVDFNDSTHYYLDDGFRHEVKYTLTPSEYFKFRDFCASFMDFDQNAGADGHYIVKSYYFDTLYLNDYMEKLNGIHNRQKYRLRTYGDSGYYRLEKKMKRGQLNKKISGELSKSDADKLIKGHFKVNTGDEKTDTIINEMYRKGYRYSSYLEYNRQAFTLKELGIRITFDRDLSVLYANYGLSLKKPKPTPVFYQGETVLEIKFREKLPEWLIKAVGWMAPSEYSIGKYVESLKYVT